MSKLQLKIQKGYTLVEILTVMAIMSVISVVAFANFGSFREDQDLNSAVLDVQNMFRLAQSNASTAVKCSSTDPLDTSRWIVELGTDRKTLSLKCANIEGVTSTITRPPNIPVVLSDITINQIGPCAASYPTNPVTVTFAASTGAASFNDTGASCVATSNTLVVTLKNTKTNNTKTVTIDKGGGVQ